MGNTFIEVLMSQLSADIVDTVQDYEIVKINQSCHCIWRGSNLYFLSKKNQFQVQLRNEIRDLKRAGMQGQIQKAGNALNI